jgi:hypothetical protein
MTLQPVLRGEVREGSTGSVVSSGLAAAQVFFLSLSSLLLLVWGVIRWLPRACHPGFLLLHIPDVITLHGDSLL